MKKLSLDEKDYGGELSNHQRELIQKINKCIDEYTAENPIFDFEFTPINYALTIADMAIVDDIVLSNKLCIMFVSFHGLCILNRELDGNGKEYNWATWHEQNQQESFVPHEYCKRYWRDFRNMFKKVDIKKI